MKIFTHYKLLFLLCISLLGVSSKSSGQYHNGWIDYSKTYWKFKVGTDGIYRIGKSQLDAAGIPLTAEGKDFILIKNGQEIPVYVSTTGSFGSSDYIEFFGTGNDGSLDKEIYIQAEKCPNPYRSIIWDTATYFLSVDNSSPHARYSDISTSIPPSPPAPASYCLYQAENLAHNGYSYGKSNAYNTPGSSAIELYSSQFDLAEGYYVSGYNTNTTANISINTPNKTSGPVNAQLHFATMARSSDSAHKVNIRFNGNLKTYQEYGQIDVKHFEISIPSAELGTSNTLSIQHINTGTSDWFGVSYWKILYPRDFDFSGLQYIRFRLEAKTGEQYLDISNFSHGGIPPVLYDISNHKRYTGDISISGKTRFLVDPMLTQSEFVLYAYNSPKIYNPAFNGSRQYTNYNQSSNQGDYIIVSHTQLMEPDAGINYVEEYRKYRNSLNGGNYNAIIADVEELYDQFAWGIPTHPNAIQEFFSFGIDKWGTKPRFAFLIGKGVTYEQYKGFRASAVSGDYEGYIPTFGHPGSDVAFVMDKNSWKQKMAIGRLSAWNRTELKEYLDKVKGYENALGPSAFPTPLSELWKKQVLHIAGGDGTTPSLQASVLIPALNNGKSIIENPATGASVYTVRKDLKGLPTVIEDKKVDSLISSGLSMVTYYGHGSSSTFDYNLSDPYEMRSIPKIPILTALGCDIAAIFSTSAKKTLPEKFIHSTTGGAIITIASNNYGYTNIHSAYLPIYYSLLSGKLYGQSIGEIVRTTSDSFINFVKPSVLQTSFEQTHMESLVLQGDPAVRTTFQAQQPDYYVGNEGLSTIPTVVTTSIDSFQLNISSFNLGKILQDTVTLNIERTFPSGATNIIKTINIQTHKAGEANSIWVYIDKTKDLGINKFKITIDPQDKYSEISEANNSASLDVFILSDNIVPVYPYDFSIVHDNSLTLKASTLNPFKGLSKYRFEIDTTEKFNSPFLRSTIIESKGGVVQWTPSLSLTDSVVYYWRTSLDSVIGGNYVWSNSSFIYLKHGSDGWNQSHYFQYKYNHLDSLRYGENRKFSYTASYATIKVTNTVMNLPSPPYIYYFYADDNKVVYNGADLQRYDCFYGGTIQVMVFDSLNGKPWANPTSGTQGSNPQCGSFARNWNCFSFNLNAAESRNNARKFIDSIPEGFYVLVRNCISANTWNGTYVDTWKNDTTAYGSGKSLYHTMRNLGFTQIDSFYQMRVFSMICRKGRTDFPILQNFAKGINDMLDTTYIIPISDEKGKMNSVQIGPASLWKTLKWKTSSYFDTAASADSSTVMLTGISESGTETLVYSGHERDLDLSFIDANSYPKLKMQWFSTDTTFHTTPQLDYWRIQYDPLPEAALNPSAHYTFTDSVEVGQLMHMETAISSLTPLAMDSMLVRYRIIDAAGISHNLENIRYRKLPGNDTLHAVLNFDPKNFPGRNYLFIEANPAKDQKEQYHPNNIGYIPFEIKTDQYAPVVDVTFDGVHILDKDIISPKPFIKVQMRDENKYLALNDTGSLKLFLKHLDGSGIKERIPYDGNICKFIPANINSGKNEAFIEFRPHFEKDGTYQLYVQGSDQSGNSAGKGNEYSITFEVINKSTITNLLNYPNPFSTSTAFLFTLTGSRMPSQFKIQILTVSGKVVREITKQEFGPIRIGRNISEYKWDGRDQYGQLLGNGVYLYRVITSIDGENVERRNSEADRFNKNGYTKMYIMR